MANSTVTTQNYYDLRKECGFSQKNPAFSYLEYLEFSNMIEFRKFRMLGRITNSELDRARRNVDGLAMALQEV